MGCSAGAPKVDTQLSGKKIVLYGSVQSPATQRVLTTLIEKGLDYELKPVNLETGEHQDSKFLEEKQPFGVIPVLIDVDGCQLYASRAICRYLEIKYRGRGTELIPTKDIQSAGLFEQAASVEISYFDTLVSPLVFECLFKEKNHLGERDDRRVAELKKQLKEKLNVYDKILSKQSFLAGEVFTLADLFHLPYGELVFGMDDDEFFTGRPHLEQWWKKISSRPSWKTVQSLCSTNESTLV